MTSAGVVVPDPFSVNPRTPGVGVTRALALLRLFYPRALAVFLLIHFPLRILGHFVRSGGAPTGLFAQADVTRVVVANGLLLVSWVLVEGAILASLVQYRRGVKVALIQALAESVRRFPSFLASRVLFLLAVLSATLLLVLPGLVVAILLMLHGWLIFDRGTNALEALRGSARIVGQSLRQIAGICLPVVGLTVLWLLVGVAFVAVTLRAAAPLIPVFKIAPFTMTLMETGFVLVPILTGIVYANFSPHPPPRRPAK